MDELHQAPYSMHFGYQKMVTTTRRLYFWMGMKKYVEEYIAKCQKYQHVKVEHQHLVGLLYPLAISEWKWETILMDFIMGFPLIVRHHDLIMVSMD